MACRTGCKTQDHETYWDCLQDASIAVDKTSLKQARPHEGRSLFNSS